MEKIELLQKLIDNANKIVVMTGAGISTASNIPDFRSSKGLYQETYGTLLPEEILSHHFFIEHPKLFYRFYFDKMIYPNALPNDGHKALVKIEKSGKKITIITQNIDGLHQKAGSLNVIELHGSILRNHCIKCRTFYTLDEILKQRPTDLPRCTKCGGVIKPDVVLYEEGLDERAINDAVSSMVDADLLIIIGTSLLVNPAAALPYYYRGKDIVIINLGPTPLDKDATLVIREKAEEILNKIIVRKEN